MAFKAAIGTLSVKISADTSDVRRGLKATNKDLSKTGKALKKNKQEWQQWGSVVKVAVVGATVLVTRGLIRYSDVFTALSNKLKISTNSTKELVAITKTLFDVSRDTRTSVATTVDLYAKLERSTRNLDISQDRLVKITSSINKSFAIMGATSAESSGAIRQLGQAFALGALRGDELNSISEQAPIIMEAVREATGKTAGELRKLAETGAITAEILIESLERYADKIDTDFAQATATFGQKIENAKTNAIEFVGANEAITKSVAFLGDGVLGLSENLDTLATALQIVAIAVGAKFIGPLIASRLALLATGAASLTASGGLLTLAGSARAAKIALAFLGGPVGILLAVVSSLAIFVDWESDAEKATKKATEKIDDQITSLKGLTAAQLELRNLDFNGAMRTNLKAIADLNVVLAEAKEKQSNMRDEFRQSPADFDANSKAVRDLEEELRVLFETQTNLQNLGAAIFETQLAPKLPTEDRAALIDIEGKAAEKAEEKRNRKALEAFSKHLLRRNQMEAKSNVALREQKLKQAEDDLAALNQKLLTEQELEGFFHQQDLATAQIAFDEGLITKTEQDATVEELERQHKQRLNDIEFTENEMKRQIFERDANSLIASIASLGKKSLKVQKAASLAQAAVAIHTGIARAQELGFPANIFEAIRVAAVGVSAIRGIKSAKVGSVSSAASAGGGGGGSATSAGGGGSTASAPQRQTARSIDVRFIGQGVLSMDQTRILIEQFREAFDDGVREFNIVGG